MTDPSGYHIYPKLERLEFCTRRQQLYGPSPKLSQAPDFEPIANAL